MKLWHISLALVALAAPIAWWSSGASEPVDAGPSTQHRDEAVASTPQISRLEMQRRTLSDRWGDLFPTPAKPPAPQQPKPVVAEIPQAPTAPPLPYKYDGSGELQGKRFVYLARDGTSSTLVHGGETLDGTYSVETVAPDHAVLRYLPLGIRQVLMYQAGAEVPPGLLAELSASRPLALQVDMPAEVVVGQEFVITLALPGTRAVKATVEVGYDHEVLRMVGPGVRSAGRALVELASGKAPRAELRFKVLAETPAPTDIGLQVNAMDASGRHIPVSSPPAHTVSLVLPGGGG